jgi:glycosyltransferase involved in cell wall biosynthesis
MPCPVDVESYANASSDGVREALGFAESDLVVTTVGQASPVKGWDILVRAFDAVSRRFPQAHLLLVGRTAAPEAAFVAELTDLVEKLGLDGKVHFAGERGDIARILKASDVFAFPSRSEGQGLALTEAMAARLPCVASAVGGIPELITHGRNGLLFPREDADQLSRHLTALLSDRSLRDRLGRRAQQESTRFAMARYVDEIVDLYETLSGAAR